MICKFWSILFGSCCQRSQKNHRTLTSDLSVLVTVLDQHHLRSVLKDSIKFNNDVTTVNKVNFTGLGSLSMYYVFQYYPVLPCEQRFLSCMAFSKCTKSFASLANQLHKTMQERNPLLAGQNVKRWGRTRFLINTVMFMWGWWLVILWGLWVTRSQIISFKAFLIIWTIYQYCFSFSWAMSVCQHYITFTTISVSALARGLLIPCCVYLFLALWENLQENLICHFFCQIVKVRVRIRNDYISLRAWSVKEGTTSAD